MVLFSKFSFLININNLPFLAGKNHEIVLFADDTLLIFKNERRQNIYDDVNYALSKVVHWFSVDNLLLNNNKSKSKIVRTSNTKIVKAVKMFCTWRRKEIILILHQY